MSEQAVRVYGSGPSRDEGGQHHHVKKQVPAWVSRAQRHCRGCRNDFYNGRANCTGNSWCFSLKQSYARRKTSPPCKH